MNHRIESLVRQWQEVQEGPNWVDENFKKKLDTLSEDQAFQRPIADVHSVAELLSHLLVWRREAIQRLNGMDRQLWMNSPENWRTNDELKAIGWESLKADFYKSQQELIALVGRQADRYLENIYSDGYPYWYLIEGLIHHDFYHLGQLGITVKLLQKTTSEARGD